MKRFDAYRDGQLILKDQTMTPPVAARIDRMVAAAAREVRIVKAGATDPPHQPSRPPGARCVYFSTVTDLAVTRLCELGAGYTALFSADLNESGPGGDYYVADTQLTMLKAAGVICASWCDCSATPYGTAKLMAATRGLAFAGGQGEDPDQYLQATEGGATHVIGEPSVLKQNEDVFKNAVARSWNGSLAFIGEVMRPDPTYSAQGVNITSACFYVDRDAKEGGYIPLAAYSVMPPSLRNGCSIYTGGKMTSEDWDTYAAWTKP